MYVHVHVASVRKVTNVNNIQWENLKGTENFGYPDVRGRIISQSILINVQKRGMY